MAQKKNNAETPNYLVRKKIIKSKLNKGSHNEITIIFTAILGCWIGGVAISFLSGFTFPELLHFDLVTNTVLLTASIFVLSMLLFGFLTPLLFIILGAMQEPMLSQQPMYFLLAVPFFFAAYSGTTMGIYLLKDLHGEDNMFAHKQKIAGYLAMSFLFAVLMPVTVLFMAVGF